MSIEEMKLEAIRRITQLHTEAEIKTVLQHLPPPPENLLNLSGNYDALKLRYEDVLKKLAQ